ncbi:hypothetical protein FA95DRAFT_1559484 [Auriscalpium vulgare]|uniref:Uncharacterized protein n=1 Tax=Auriscalpium vulgare TaxID=40419 RepID=A0ACB8RTX3_9AGAM|nr:hypothetical protein FA95DRAFT_1559484 [Auriscalpium vulgare]
MSEHRHHSASMPTKHVPFTFLVLPQELTITVLQNLDLLTLLACRQTCRALKGCVDESSALQYHIALERTGTRDNPASGHPTHERLHKLTDYTNAWTQLRWTEHTVLPSNEPSDPKFHAWALRDGIWAQVFDRKIVFNQLPSRLRGIVASRWEIAFSFHVEDFVFDASQDLLVVVERDLPHIGPPYKHTLHIRSLTTGENHPLSVSPRLPILPFGGKISGSDSEESDLAGNDEEPADGALEIEYAIKISGEYCGILFSSGGQPDRASLSILDWKSAAMIWEMSSATIRAFAFLDGERCLVAVLSNWKVPVQPSLDIWLFSNSYEGRVCSSFRFPSLTQGEDLDVDFYMYIGNPTNPTCPSNRNAPFALDSADQLQLLSVLYIMSSEDDFDLDFAVIIRLSSLLPRIDADIAEQCPQTHDYDWADWAEDAVRVTNISTTLDHGFVCGMRFVNPAPIAAPSRRDGEHSMANFVAVNDFHPYRLRDNPFQNALRPDEDLMEDVYPLSDYVEDFRYGAGNQLPLSVTLAELPAGLQNGMRSDLLFFLSDDNIVVMESGRSDRNPKIHLLTF